MIKKKVVQSLVKANVSLQVNANLGSLNKIREKNSSNNDLYYKHVTFFDYECFRGKRILLAFLLH